MVLPEIKNIDNFFLTICSSGKDPDPSLIMLIPPYVQPVRARHAREAEARATESRGGSGGGPAARGPTARSRGRREEGPAHQDIHKGARGDSGEQGGARRSAS